MNAYYIAAAGIVSGMLGAMGMGGGGVLIIALTVFFDYEQTLAQGINLIFFIPCAIIAIIIYSFKKLIDWKNAFFFSLLGCAGAFVGAMVSSSVNNHILSLIFGIALIIMGIKELLS